MKVLVTRAQPANAKTCDALRAIGYEPISLPLFALHDTGASFPQENFDGYIFTSSNAAQILLTLENLNLNYSLPAYCVGAKTARKVEQLGFKKIEIAGGNVQMLCELIASKNLEPNTSLLYLTTKDRSFEISDHLTHHKIKITNLELYQMNPIEIERDKLIKTLSEITNGTILVYSKSSGEHLAQLLEQAQIDIAAHKISLIAISQEAASALKPFPWERFQAAPVANEHSMLHILNE